jgi:hypothetical protein
MILVSMKLRVTTYEKYDVINIRAKSVAGLGALSSSRCPGMGTLA